MPKPASEACVASHVAKPSQAPHEHRVERQGFGALEGAQEELVVPRRRDPEALADRSVLRPAPPAVRTLELQHPKGELVEPGGEVDRHRVHPTRLATGSDVGQGAAEAQPARARI
jgi:hypothetical protein